MPYDLGPIKFKVNSKIEKATKARLQKHIESRVEKSLSKIRDRVARIVLSYVRDNKTYQGFLHEGGVGQDLRAEFGLETWKANQALRQLDKVILNHGVRTTKPTIVLMKRKAAAGVAFRIEVLHKDMYYTLLTRSQLFYYYSSSSVDKKDYTTNGRLDFGEYKAAQKTRQKHKIDWMRWVLEGHRGDAAMKRTLGPSIKNHGIRYNLVPGHSRSGRAIMTSRETVPYGRFGKMKEQGTLVDDKGFAINQKARATRSGQRTLPADRFPYEFPEAATPAPGSINFLDETSRNRSMRNIIIETVRTMLLKDFSGRINLGRNPVGLTKYKN